MRAVDAFFEGGDVQEAFRVFREWMPTSGAVCSGVLQHIEGYVAAYPHGVRSAEFNEDSARDHAVAQMSAWMLLDCFKKLVPLLPDPCIVEAGMRMMDICCNVPYMQPVHPFYSNYEACVELLEFAGYTLLQVSHDALKAQSERLIDCIMALFMTLSSAGTKFHPEFSIAYSRSHSALLNFIDVVYLITADNAGPCTEALVRSDFPSAVDALLNVVRDPSGRAQEKVLELVWWCAVHQRRRIASAFIDSLEHRDCSPRVAEVLLDLQWVQ